MHPQPDTNPSNRQNNPGNPEALPKAESIAQDAANHRSEGDAAQRANIKSAKELPILSLGAVNAARALTEEITPVTTP